MNEVSDVFSTPIAPFKLKIFSLSTFCAHIMGSHSKSQWGPLQNLNSDWTGPWTGLTAFLFAN